MLTWWDVIGSNSCLMNIDTCKKHLLYFISAHPHICNDRLWDCGKIHFMPHLFNFNGSEVMKENKINAKRSIYFMLCQMYGQHY